MISAGHDARRPGIVANGYRESDIVLDFRDLVSTELAALGIRHLLDGDKGENLPLADATDIASRCDIAIEFHANGGGPGATGVETLSRARHKPIGAALCLVTADLLAIANRGAKPEDAGQHHRLAFVSDGGGIIHELFFLSSEFDLDAYLLHQRALAHRVAGVIAEAARAQ
jgi:N-acetylmuramoyl-L-alanine amidase